MRRHSAEYSNDSNNWSFAANDKGQQSKTVSDFNSKDENAMKIRLSLILLAVLALSALPSGAQAPAGSTGLCKDGTYTTAAKKRGSCNDHGGVKAWFGAPIPQAAPLSPQVSAPAPVQPVAAAGTTAPVPSQTATAPPTPTPVQSSAEPPSQVPATADSVKVWVNLASSVYHCPGSDWYGKTKSGKYMSQAEAIAMGARTAYNKACSR